MPAANKTMPRLGMEELAQSRGAFAAGPSSLGERSIFPKRFPTANSVRFQRGVLPIRDGKSLAEILSETAERAFSFYGFSSLFLSLFFFSPSAFSGDNPFRTPPLSSPCTAHRSCSPLPACPDRSAGESGSSAAWYRLRAARISLQLAIREKRRKRKKEKKKTCEKSSHYLIET